MDKKISLKPISAAIGATFAVSMAAASVVNAEENPFSLSELSSGYMLAEAGSAAKGSEGRCGEGKCGGKRMMKKMDTDGDGNVSRDEFMKHHESMFSKMDADGNGMLAAGEMSRKGKEGSCGEGKCGEGKCGEGKCAGKMKEQMEKSGEGKCGEGKCGGSN